MNVQTESAVRVGGAAIQLDVVKPGVGTPVCLVACPDSTLLQAIDSPLFSMQLRGYAGSKVAE